MHQYLDDTLVSDDGYLNKIYVTLDDSIFKILQYPYDMGNGDTSLMRPKRLLLSKMVSEISLKRSLFIPEISFEDCGCGNKGLFHIHAGTIYISQDMLERASIDDLILCRSELSSLLLKNRTNLQKSERFSSLKSTGKNTLENKTMPRLTSYKSSSSTSQMDSKESTVNAPKSDPSEDKPESHSQEDVRYDGDFVTFFKVVDQNAFLKIFFYAWVILSLAAVYYFVIRFFWV